MPNSFPHTCLYAFLKYSKEERKKERKKGKLKKRKGRKGQGRNSTKQMIKNLLASFHGAPLLKL